MKTILLITVLFAITSQTGAIKLKERVNRMKLSTLPSELTNSEEYPKPMYSINGLDLTTRIPRYVYGDVGKKTRLINNGDINYYLFRSFDIQKNNFVLVDVFLINVPGDNRHFLVTLDKNYQMIDTLEVAAEGCHIDWFCTKQYRLNVDLTLMVYDLQPTSDKILRYQVDQFDSFEAQRVDTHYRINDDGKFVKGKEIRYKPQTYKMEELYQKGHGIWNGKEIPQETP